MRLSSLANLRSCILTAPLKKTYIILLIFVSIQLHIEVQILFQFSQFQIELNGLPLSIGEISGHSDSNTSSSDSNTLHPPNTRRPVGRPKNKRFRKSVVRDLEKLISLYSMRRHGTQQKAMQRSNLKVC